MKALLHLIAGFVLLCMCPEFSFAGVNSWSLMGTTVPVTGGRIVCLTVHPDGALMVGSLFDGAFRSRDNGMTWEQMSPASGTVSNILVHPVRAEEIYVGTLEGLLKTTDNGTSWAIVLDQAIFSLAFDLVTPSTLYAGTSEGIFRSRDGGATWVQESNGLETEEGVLPFIGSIVVNHLNPKILYLLASNSNRHQPPTFLSGSGEGLPPTKNSRLGLFKTTDGGEIWFRLQAGLPVEDTSVIGRTPYNADSTMSLALAYSDPMVIYYTTGVDFYRSTDAGNTFEQLEEPNTHQSVLSRGVNAILSVPTDRQLLYGAGTFTGLFRTTDRGITWKSMNSGFPNLTYMPSILAISIAEPTELFAATVNNVWHYAVRSVDFSEDGKTDFEDFTLFAGGFGKEKGEPEFEDRLDLDGNNKIDFADFLIFVQGYAIEN